ncbi:MAG: hypothetical protein R3192_13045 [Woeseiaceae bacterium]|nr:hypothetical protein [Woeseiaceae bacterium]
MNRENFQFYASIAEVVSAIAIVVSLLYVGYEIRQSVVFSSRDIEETLYARQQEDNRIFIENGNLAQIVATARDHPDQLSAADRSRYLAFAHNLYDSWEIAFYAHRDGILRDGAWDSWNEYFVRQSRIHPNFAWTENRQYFPGEFSEYVDGIVQE